MWPASRFFHKLSLSLCHLKHQQEERDETCKTKTEMSTSIQIFTQWTHRNIWCAIHGAFSQICEHDATYFYLPTLYLLVWLCMHVLFHTFAVLLHTKPNLTVGDLCVRESTSLLIHDWIPLKCSSCAFPSLAGMESNSLTLLCNPGFVEFLIMAESLLNSKSYYYTQCTILLLRHPADMHTNTHAEKSRTPLLMSSTVTHVLTHKKKIPPIPLRKFHII